MKGKGSMLPPCRAATSGRRLPCPSPGWALGPACGHRGQAPRAQPRSPANLGARGAGAHQPQQGHLCAREQTRAHRLGGLGEARKVSEHRRPRHRARGLASLIPQHRFPQHGLRRETPLILATTVGPARGQADNSADRSMIAQNVWLPVRRFHVGTSAQTLTSDAGYKTATDSRVDLLNSAFLLPRGRSPYTVC